MNYQANKHSVNTSNNPPCPENGTQQLDLVEIGDVMPDDEGGFKFVYLPGESDATIWPGESSA